MSIENSTLTLRCDSAQNSGYSPVRNDESLETFIDVKLANIKNSLQRMSGAENGENIENNPLHKWIKNLSDQLEKLDLSRNSLAENALASTEKAVDDIVSSFETVLPCIEELQSSPNDIEASKKIDQHCKNIAKQVQKLTRELEGRPSYWESAALILGGAALSLMGHTILAPVAIVTGLGWGVYQACCNSKLGVISATIQLLIKVSGFVQNSVLMPTYSYAKGKVWTPVCDRYRPETKLDKKLADLKDELFTMGNENGEIQNYELREQFKFLSGQLKVLNLTRNLLPFEEDFKNTEKIAEGILRIFQGENGEPGLLSLMKAVDGELAFSPDGSNIKSLTERVQNYFLGMPTQQVVGMPVQRVGGVLEKVGILKEKCDKLKERKESLENLKSAASIVGGAALFAGGYSVLLLSLPIAALWLAYEIHHSYRGKILDQAVELLNEVEKQKAQIDSQLQKAELAETKEAVQSLQTQTESNTQQLSFLKDNLAGFASFLAIQNGSASTSE